MHKLLKRKEVIELWQSGTKKYLDYYCCPDCRDVLKKAGDTLSCANMACENTNEYNLQGFEIDK